MMPAAPRSRRCPAADPRHVADPLAGTRAIMHESDSSSSSAPTTARGGTYLAPWERAFDRIASPFEEFIHNQTSGGIVLMVATVIALVIANSPLADAYQDLLHTQLVVGVGEWTLAMSAHHWINDGLMALFFFLVGLEIKREVLVGELASARQEALPIFAAIGGMVVPALLYWTLNPEGDAARGWGIPMATDIAFAVGVLALLGNRVPNNLLMFLVALAIVDDMGAVLVIALFYTAHISVEALMIGVVLFAVLVACNRLGVRRGWPYFVLGMLLWLALLKSGVHATIAGMLVAARPMYGPLRFSTRVRGLRDRLEASHRPGVGILANAEQVTIIQTLDNAVYFTATPLQRLEHRFHLPVAMLVIPIFALANAGISIEIDALGELVRSPVLLGVLLGLAAGKVIGIAGFVWLATRLKLATLPTGVAFRHIVGVGMIGGIGFTMSIFVSELAFADRPEQLLMAKTGILIASLIAGIAGYLWMRRALR